MSQQQADTHIYRGRSLEELVPKIRSELGDDAVIVARRETTAGGVGGFFARREIEVEVRPGESAAAQAFAAQLAQAQAHPDPSSHVEIEEWDTPTVRPAVSHEIDALPSASDVTVDDLFPSATPPPQGGGLAALFNAGLPPAAEPAMAEPPAVAEPQTPMDVEQPTGAFDFLAQPEPESAPEPQSEPEVVPEPELFTQAPHPVEIEPMPVGVAPAELELPAELEPEPDPLTEAPALSGLALPAGVRAVADRLAARGLRAELAAAVAEEAIVGLAPLDPVADPQTLVVDALARRIPIHALRRGPGVVGFVGPGGSGKTRCAARLAAAYARHSTLAITVVSLRSPDEGAELTRLLAPYDVALHSVGSGAEAAAHIAGLRGQGLVIVDTQGVSPRNHAELRALAAELEILAPDELHLAVPATIGPDAARELVGGVRELGVSALVITHTDETEQLGTVIGLAIDSGVPLSYLARGQAIDMGLRPASASELAGDLAP